MSAATQDIDTPIRRGESVRLPAAAATQLFAGAIGARNASGQGVPAADSAGLCVIGRIEEGVDNRNGAAGALNVEMRRGVFRWANRATHPASREDIGKIAYVEDDQTVSLNPGQNAIEAGAIFDVDDDGVWVDTDKCVAAAAEPESSESSEPASSEASSSEASSSEASSSEAPSSESSSS